MQVPNITTTGTAANAYIDNSNGNNLLRSTSSARYKIDIETLDPKFIDNLWKMRPIWFRSNTEICTSDNPRWSWWGFAAEEMAAIDPRLVHWTYPDSAFDYVTVGEGEGQVTNKVLKDGAVLIPDGVQYERVTVLLLAALRDMESRLRKLEGAPPLDPISSAPVQVTDYTQLSAS